MARASTRLHDAGGVAHHPKHSIVHASRNKASRAIDISKTNNVGDLNHLDWALGYVVYGIRGHVYVGAYAIMHVCMYVCAYIRACVPVCVLASCTCMCIHVCMYQAVYVSSLQQAPRAQHRTMSPTTQASTEPLLRPRLDLEVVGDLASLSRSPEGRMTRHC